MKSNLNVSVIINAHNENLLLHKTLRSINENVIIANDAGIDVEVIIVADKVDDKTRLYLEERASDALKADFSVEYVEYGDLGLSRNHGIETAKNSIIANFDGDDIWSRNWLRDGVKFLENKPDIIAHPAAVLNFGAKNGVWHIKDSTSPDFNPRSLIEDNWWPSCMMAHKAVFDKVKYQKTRRDRQFSFEDWLFNCETLDAGYEHQAVPKTAIFYRRKKISMLVQQISGIPTPNRMFTLEGQRQYIERRKVDSPASGDAHTPVSSDNSIPGRDQTIARKIAVGTIKGGGRIVVGVGKKYLKPHIDSRHRLKRYLSSIKDATHTLIANPADAASAGAAIIPGWLRDEWERVNHIEPHLFPTYSRVSTAYSRKMMTMGLEQDAYWSIATELGDDIDYILVLPYVRRAGAYMVGMYYVKAYKELFPDANVAVLTTEDKYESISGMIPEGVKHVSVPESFYKLDENLKNRVLGKVFTYLKPKYVHALHSREGFKALERYPAQVSFASKIILSTFNYDYTAEGQKMNALVAYGDEILPYVTRVLTDNEWVARDTIDIYGIKEDIVRAHMMPIRIIDGDREGVSARDMDGKMRILWAARMAKQKRPDILLDIAIKANKLKLPVEFIVYGDIYDNNIPEKALKKLSSLPNVQYRGAFHDGFQKLPTKEFDVYLSTSEAEGAPNAIMEAQEASLLVLAPSVGGIPEVAADGEMGILVDDFSDIDQYIEKIQYIYENRDIADSIVSKARKNIENNRSWDAFVQSFKLDL